MGAWKAWSMPESTSSTEPAAGSGRACLPRSSTSPQTQEPVGFATLMLRTRTRRSPIHWMAASRVAPRE